MLSLRLGKNSDWWCPSSGVLREHLDVKGNEVTAGWKKLQSEELHNLYFSPNIIETSRPCSAHGEDEKVCKILAWTCEGNKQLGRFWRSRRE